MVKAVAWKTAMLVSALLCAGYGSSWAEDEPVAETIPQFEHDASWPKLPLPNDWAIGLIGGIFVDARDHVWIYHSPDLVANWAQAAATEPKRALCCIPAPHVLEFDTEGNIVRAWGGPGEGYDWPSDEHGLYVDYKGNVWLAGSKAYEGDDDSPQDGMVLKFSPDGEFLLQIGGRGPSKGNLDTTQLSGASNVAVDPETNEVFISDGYGNRRIIVFDADTGEFKRMWGAYGEPPSDEEMPAYDPDAAPSTQFSLVHCIRISDDGLVYVCDRRNNRMQVFQKDGTFVAEYIYDKETLSSGSVGNVAFWPDEEQSILAINDPGNFRVRFVRRSDGEVLGHFGHFGTYGGEFDRNHQIEFDSHGNLYVSEDFRVQKFTVTGGPSLD
jgi:DNA-binding beta-propeller fold protein YncE